MMESIKNNPTIQTIQNTLGRLNFLWYFNRVMVPAIGATLVLGLVMAIFVPDGLAFWKSAYEHVLSDEYVDQVQSTTWLWLAITVLGVSGTLVAWKFIPLLRQKLHRRRNWLVLLFTGLIGTMFLTVAPLVVWYAVVLAFNGFWWEAVWTTTMAGFLMAPILYPWWTIKGEKARRLKAIRQTREG